MHILANILVVCALEILINILMSGLEILATTMVYGLEILVHILVFALELSFCIFQKKFKAFNFKK